MDKRLQAGLLLAVAVVAGGAGFYFGRDRLNDPVADGAAGKLISASLTDLSGKPQAMSQWRGKVLVVNFWATWCVPCREEIPALLKVEEKYAQNGVKIVGIAIDNAVKVREYAEEMRISYALLIGDAQTLTVSKELGNRAGVLPFTVVLDRTGKAAYVHAGALTEASLGAALEKLL